MDVTFREFKKMFKRSKAKPLFQWRGDDVVSIVTIKGYRWRSRCRSPVSKTSDRDNNDRKKDRSVNDVQNVSRDEPREVNN